MENFFTNGFMKMKCHILRVHEGLRGQKRSRNREIRKFPLTQRKNDSSLGIPWQDRAKASTQPNKCLYCPNTLTVLNYIDTRVFVFLPISMDFCRFLVSQITHTPNILNVLLTLLELSGHVIVKDPLLKNVPIYRSVNCKCLTRTQ